MVRAAAATEELRQEESAPFLGMVIELTMEGVGSAGDLELD